MLHGLASLVRCYMGWRALSDVTWAGEPCQMLHGLASIWQMLHGLASLGRCYMGWRALSDVTWAGEPWHMLHGLASLGRCYMGWRALSDVTWAGEPWHMLHGLASLGRCYMGWRALANVTWAGKPCQMPDLLNVPYNGFHWLIDTWLVEVFVILYNLNAQIFRSQSASKLTLLNVMF